MAGLAEQCADFRLGCLETGAGEDLHQVHVTQLEGHPQLLQHQVVVDAGFHRTLRLALVAAAQVHDQAIEEVRQRAVAHCFEAGFVLAAQPGLDLLVIHGERRIGHLAQGHHVVVAQVQGVAHAAQDIVVDHGAIVPVTPTGGAGSGRSGNASPGRRCQNGGLVPHGVACMTRTVLITGATSGFGAAAVHRFAQAGWKVIATGRRSERLQPLVERYGKDVWHAAAFDIRDPVAMEAALLALPPAFGEIDLLVNNAGLAQGTAPAQGAKLSDWTTMIDTNITALVTLTHRLLPQLVERKGAIINISSVAGVYPSRWACARTCTAPACG
ncbi:hypothetical protein G6F57_009771 [Rhizopus arrhizus]|nr:hypothetical protein G6F57_009771 [Rhizopus arrhizus]